MENNLRNVQEICSLKQELRFRRFVPGFFIQGRRSMEVFPNAPSAPLESGHVYVYLGLWQLPCGTAIKWQNFKLKPENTGFGHGLSMAFG